MADNITGFRVDANINPFEESMRRMVDAARKGQAGVGSSFSDLSQGLFTLKGALLAIPALMTGGLVGSIIQSADAMDELSEKTGVSVKSLAGLQYAAKMGGASSESLTVGLRTLSKSLSEVGQGNKDLTRLFDQLGVKATDASGQLRKADDVLLDLADVFPRLQDADRIAVAMQLLGKAGMDMVPMLSGGREGLESMVKEGQRLNPITEDLAKKAGLFNDNLDKIGMTIRASLMPAVSDLLPVVNKLSEEMLLGTKVFGGFWGTVRGIGPINGFRDTTEQVKAFSEEVADLEASLKRYQAAGSDTSGLSQALTMARQRLQYFKELQALENNRIADASSKDPSNYGNEARGRGMPARKPDPLKIGGEKDKAAKEPSQMPIYEAELAKKIELFEKAAQAEGTLRQFSKAEEAAYWQEVSNRAGISAEDKARAEKKWRDLERGLRTESFAVEMADLDQRKQAAQNNFAQRIALAEQAHAKTVAMYGAESKEAAAAYGKVLEEKRKQVQQQAQLANIEAQMRRDKALADIEADRQDADHMLAMGLITKEQLLQQQILFEERMHAVKLQALKDSLSLMVESDDPVKYAEVKEKILQAEQQYQLKLKGLKNQLNAQQASPEFNIFGNMQTAFGEAITGMLTRAQTLREGMASIFKSISTAFLQEMVTKPLAMVAARVIRESALYKLLAGAAISNQQLASGTTTALVAGEQAPKLAAIAPVAAAKSAESQANIPYVGPILAAAAFAAMMSMVLGGGKGGGGTTTTRIPSASGGFDIPRGLNPMTQLHEQEMVLPAHIANPLRESLAQGSQTTGQGGDGAPVVIHTTGGDFVHKRDLAKLLTTMKRDYRFQT